MEAEFAAADGEGEETVGDYPQCQVEEEEDGYVDMPAQQVVQEGQDYAGCYYGGHGHALGHAEGQELVVDVGLVGKEGAAPCFEAVDVDSHHVAARDEQRGKCHDCRVDVQGVVGDAADAD